MEELIRAIVREELAKALADVQRPAEYLSTSEAAELAGVDPRTIRRWIRAGKLESYKAGREIRIHRADLDDVMRGSHRDALEDLSPAARAARDFA